MPGRRKSKVAAAHFHPATVPARKTSFSSLSTLAGKEKLVHTLLPSTSAAYRIVRGYTPHAQGKMETVLGKSKTSNNPHWSPVRTRPKCVCCNNNNKKFVALPRQRSTAIAVPNVTTPGSSRVATQKAQKGSPLADSAVRVIYVRNSSVHRCPPDRPP